MTITAEIKGSLEREFNICSTTVNFYKRQLKALEKKYKMTTASFLAKFEKGALGDEKDFFDWYAFHKLLSSWTSTKKALQPLIK
ncbi:MAG: hypothetical protein HZA14_06260 [Nitrospirae bacterium]|nr:hypothetical protein [Nitrospirota bacterium]